MSKEQLIRFESGSKMSPSQKQSLITANAICKFKLIKGAVILILICACVQISRTPRLCAIIIVRPCRSRVRLRNRGLSRTSRSKSDIISER
jgi:hypothetical protein